MVKNKDVANELFEIIKKTETLTEKDKNTIESTIKILKETPNGLDKERFSLSLSGKEVRGASLLLCAAAHKKEDIAQALLEGGADPNAEAYNGLRPLHVVAQHSLFSLAEQFIQKGAKINARDGQGRQPIIQVIQTWHEGKRMGHFGHSLKLDKKTGKMPSVSDENTVKHQHAAETLKVFIKAEIEEAQKTDQWEKLEEKIVFEYDHVNQGQGDRIEKILVSITWLTLAIELKLAPDSLKALIEQVKAEYLNQRENGLSPLGVAIQVRYGEIFDLLIKNGADLTESYSVSHSNNNIDKLLDTKQLLLTFFTQETFETVDPKSIIGLLESQENIQDIIQAHGTEGKSDDFLSLLMLAVTGMAPQEIIEFLVQHGDNVNSDVYPEGDETFVSKTALEVACEHYCYHSKINSPKVAYDWAVIQFLRQKSSQETIASALKQVEMGASFESYREKCKPEIKKILEMLKGPAKKTKIDQKDSKNPSTVIQADSKATSSHGRTWRPFIVSLLVGLTVVIPLFIIGHYLVNRFRSSKKMGVDIKTPDISAETDKDMIEKSEKTTMSQGFKAFCVFYEQDVGRMISSIKPEFEYIKIQVPSEKLRHRLFH